MFIYLFTSGGPQETCSKHASLTPLCFLPFSFFSNHLPALSPPPFICKSTPCPCSQSTPFSDNLTPLPFPLSVNLPPISLLFPIPLICQSTPNSFAPYFFSISLTNSCSSSHLPSPHLCTSPQLSLYPWHSSDSGPLQLSPSIPTFGTPLP